MEIKKSGKLNSNKNKTIVLLHVMMLIISVAPR
jgi:hypothetical protein